MKLLFFTCYIFLLGSSSFAQSMVTHANEDGYLKNADGSLVQKNTTFIEEGSSSLPVKNCVALLKTRGGKVYNNVKGRIDLQTEGFIFSVKDEDFKCVLPIEQITFDSCDAALTGAIFKTGFPSIDKQNDKSFYQVLSQGKATLLKHYGVKWQDITPFNTTNTTRQYTQSQEYYLFLNSKMSRLEKDKASLLELLGTSKDYVSRNKLNLKKEEDSIKLVEYFNSL